MKKGKVLGKTQVAVAVMVAALALAIWLNMKYTPTSKKYLGEATYVNNTVSEGKAVQTAAKVKETGDYFEKARKEREEARAEATETLEELFKSSKLTEEEKKEGMAKAEEIALRAEKENKIETLLEAKGFEQTVAIISDSGVSVVVKSEGLTSAQTLQIQDIVTAQTKVKLSDIKIIPVQ